jgi:hypothetical protein
MTELYQQMMLNSRTRGYPASNFFSVGRVRAMAATPAKEAQVSPASMTARVSQRAGVPFRNR